ncbi:hypothetical protein [Litoribrevibacter albus]|uniref:Phasin domain-containing protein n=1 Tax=Litoribrevibacter albus TaxID=1473156 RepID=A0AA37W7L9_9GAMM|nr:hypothetical protein [Litoribrevibacter albus]GLQ32712.1 hypothetical protein GCM10007876_31910 [Litoribrevibacter albus]
MNKLINRIEIAKDFAQTMIEQTITSVQGVHNTIANTSYELIKLTPANPILMSDLKQRHDEVSGQVYETIRAVNQQVGGLASELFGSLEDSKAADQAMNQATPTTKD